jgi:hypothetical protein
MGYGFLMGAAHPRGIVIPEVNSLLAAYDGLSNINGANNAGLVDGAAIGTFKNTSPGAGSLGAAADLAPGAAPFTFRAVATPGFIGNKSAVDSNGTQFQSSGVFPLLSQRILLALLFRPAALGATQLLMSGAVPGELLIYINGGDNKISIDAGAGGIGQGMVPAQSKWNIVLADFNGAASVCRLNGVQNNSADPGTGGLTALSLAARPAGAAIFSGMIGWAGAWRGTIPSYADVEQYIAARCVTAFGAFPVG